MSYSEHRNKLCYMRVARCLLSLLARENDSIIDIGSLGTDIISHLPCKLKVSLDLNQPLMREGITAIKQDFFEYVPEEIFDIVCCF